MQSVYQGRIVEVVEYEVEVAPGKKKMFEKARRAPGVRLIIRDAAWRFLLNKEWRYELGEHDWRLPGGKVVDTLQEWISIVDAWKDVLPYVEEAARREALEEAWLIVESMTIVTKKVCGATMERDLWYVLVDDWIESERIHEEWEHIEWYERFSWDALRDMLAEGSIQEGRSAAILAQLLLSKTA